MIKHIIKRNGETEEFTPNKLNHWAEWASKELNDRVDWSGVTLEVYKDLPETVSSQELQQKMIDVCVLRSDWAHSLMAGRLYAALMHKQNYGATYGGVMPTILEMHSKLIELGLMRKLNYSDEDYLLIEEIIDHSNDFNLAKFQIDQLIKKYSISDRTTNTRYETPQYTFMRMAMALAESTDVNIRINEVKEYYTLFFKSIINPPTPNYVNLGTPHNGYASCCLFISDDNANSLAIGDHIAYIMTCMSAGIGANINTRSIGDKVRSGLIEHQGKLSYYKSLAGAVNANLQTGRGGACTTFYSVFDPEAEIIALLQNPRTTEDKRNRDLHFAILLNFFFIKKVAKNEDIFTFNVKTAPDLTDAFYNGDSSLFEKVYLKYENDPTFIKNYVNARKLFVTAYQQGYEVGTHYLAFIDEINRHTPHKDKIHSSNLCVAPETLILTKEYGYCAISVLENKDVNVWNGKQWSLTKVVKTGTNQKLIKVTLSIGDHLYVTPYHKWYLTVDDKEVEKRTNELNVNDVLIEYSVPDNGVINISNNVKVISVEDTGRYDDTYCVNEPLEHKVIFNGILTGNCLEITEPTAPYQSMMDLYSSEDHGKGEIALCSLAGLVVSNITSDEEYEKAAYYALKMIDTCINISTYPLPHLEVTAKARMNAGVGIIGLATHLARLNLSYSSKEGKQEIHKVAERHAYFLIKASLKLGKELGNAPWIHKTKWPDGWLPIDTYKKNVDKVVDPIYNYDWEALRAEIIENKGIRNSSLIAHMPTESSSKASGAPNGVYPVRSAILKKKDGSNVIDWVATDSDLISYESAWNINTLDMIECYAIIQKFSDQAISADLYKNRVTDLNVYTDDMIKEAIHMVKFGMKTRYYQNSLTSDQNGDLIEPDQEVGCGSGGCSL